MDYGQPVNTPNQEPFFTAGVGNASEINNPDKVNSLLSEEYSVERDPKNLGNAAMTSSEQAPINTELEPTEEIANDQALGQIVNLEMPPMTEQPEETEVQKTSNFNQSAIKTTGKLSRAGFQAIESATSKLSKDGDANAFYEEIRGQGGLVEANLKNSYGRGVEL